RHRIDRAAISAPLEAGGMPRPTTPSPTRLPGAAPTAATSPAKEGEQVTPQRPLNSASTAKADDDERGRRARASSPEKRGRSKSVMSLFRRRDATRSPEKVKDRTREGEREDRADDNDHHHHTLRKDRSPHKSRSRKHTLRGLTAEDTATATATTTAAAAAETDGGSANDAPSPTPSSGRSLSPSKTKSKKSATNLSSLFKLSSSRLRQQHGSDEPATEPPSPTKSERGAAGREREPVIPTYDGSADGHAPAPATATASPPRPASPSKQHRKSDFSTSRGVLDLLKSLHTRGEDVAVTDGPVERRDIPTAGAASSSNSNEGSQPLKKKGSNVAALISVFNQRAGSGSASGSGTGGSGSGASQSDPHRRPPSATTSQPNSQSSRRSGDARSGSAHGQAPKQSWTQAELDSAFEDLLDSRNIPHNMRDKMRSLDVNIKTDFVQRHQRSDDSFGRAAGSGGASASASTSAWTLDAAATASEKSSRSRLLTRRGKSRSRSEDDGAGDSKTKDRQHGRDKDADRDRDRDGGTKSRRSRLRSRTFSRDSIKRRPRSNSKQKRPKSLDFGRPASVRSFVSTKSGQTSVAAGGGGGGGGASSDSTSASNVGAPEQPDDTIDPADFVHYLREVQKPELVKVAKLHKLRLLLRNETVGWVDEFIWEGGMDEIVGLIYRILAVEWREDHEDALLHEALLCLKALSTTSAGLVHLEDVEDTLFPTLLAMLFDEERKGPAEFTTRGLVMSLLLTHLSAPAPEARAKRSDKILSFLRDPTLPREEQPPTFIQNMHTVRPYKVWCREVTNVSREVFWIFLHHMNIIPLPKPKSRTKKPTMSQLNLAELRPTSLVGAAGGGGGGGDADGQADGNGGGQSETFLSLDRQSSVGTAADDSYYGGIYGEYADTADGTFDDGDDDDENTPFCVQFFPHPRTPVPAAPHVGGVEWDATNYIATHLDLLNGLVATQPTLDRRNALRHDLQISGFEKVMGATLRTCKEKFYPAVHDALRLWVAAAVEDGWEAEPVRRGQRRTAEIMTGSVGMASVVRVPAAGGRKKKDGAGAGAAAPKSSEAPRVDLVAPTPRLSLDLEICGAGPARGRPGAAAFEEESEIDTYRHQETHTPHTVHT
ncbi:hypothetical protein KEM52_000190, partial [Ascosphaera acerosa]